MFKNVLMTWVVICSVILPNNAQQITWLKTFELNPDQTENATTMTLMPDGYAFATIQDCTGNNDLCSNLVIVDLNGNLLSYSTFTGDIFITEIQYRAIDSTFMCLGEQYIEYEPAMYSWAPFLMKVSWEGDTIWAVTISPATQDYARDLVELPDGSFIMTAISDKPGPYESAINKIDATGKLLWDKTFFHGFWLEEPEGVVLESDSTILINYNGEYIPFDSLNVAYWNGFGLVRMDFDGNVLKDTAYILSTSSTFGRSLPSILMTNGQRVVVSSRESDVLTETPGWHFMGVDSSWSLKWAVNFPQQTHGNLALGDLTPDRNGGFVGCGQVYYHDISTDLPSICWVFAVDSNGELRWERFIPYSLAPKSGWLDQIHQTADGGFIVLGVWKDIGTQAKAMLIKLDSTGCLQPGCSDLSIIIPTKEVDFEMNNGFSIYPNPASNHLFFQKLNGSPDPEMELVNALGQLVFHQKQAENGPILLPKLPDGLYFVRFFVDGSLRQTEKLVIQKE